MRLVIFEILAGDSTNKATYTVQKDQRKKVDPDVNTISVESGKILIW